MPPAQAANVPETSAPGYPHPRPDSKALASLILGILGVFFSIVTGIPAIILGHLVLAEAKKSAQRVPGEGMALAGLILGYISVALVPFLLMIAIPYFQHSKAAANQAAAASTVQTLTFAQVTYSTNYPKAGYAPDLATLGPGGPICAAGEGSQKNACLIDSELGCPGGTSGNWCIKEQYRYSIVSIIKNGIANDYIITATPVNSSAGQTNYCADSDGIIRYHADPPLSAPIKTVAECNSWKAI